MNRNLALGAVVTALLMSGNALAHGLAAAFVSIETADDHRADILIKQPTLEGRSPGLTVRLAEDCKNATEPARTRHGASVTDRWVVECESAFTGMEVEVVGLDTVVGEAFIELRTPEIESWHAMVRRDAPKVRLGRGALDATGLDASYFSLGIEHIITGFDHLLFVLGLFLIVVRTRAGAGQRAIARGVLATVTAFTVGHSITLAAATIGLVRVPSEPTELLIALSVLLLAVELARGEHDTWTMRFPWLVAFAFGLLHGFGFAGALTDIGLPAEGIAAPLFLFNAGVEVGQIAVVFAAAMVALGTAVVVRGGTKRGLRSSVFETAAIYVIGTLATYWCFERAGQWWL